MARTFLYSKDKMSSLFLLLIYRSSPFFPPPFCAFSSSSLSLLILSVLSSFSPLILFVHSSLSSHPLSCSPRPSWPHSPPPPCPPPSPWPHSPLTQSGKSPSPVVGFVLRLICHFCSLLGLCTRIYAWFAFMVSGSEAFCCFNMRRNFFFLVLYDLVNANLDFFFLWLFNGLLWHYICSEKLSKL